MNYSEQALKEWASSPLLTQVEKKRLEYLLKEGRSQLEENFSGELQFGTGGLRAVMDVGSNCLNSVTVARAAQAFAQFILRHGQPPLVFVGYDTRNNSPHFAKVSARVFSAQGIKVYLASTPIATPQVSFLCRHLSAGGAVMITASHNPPQYNGFKVFNPTGAQLLAHEDSEILALYKENSSLKDLRFNEEDKNIFVAPLHKAVGKEPALLDAYYEEALKNMRPFNDDRDEGVMKRQKDVPLVYTPLQGVGSWVVPEMLRRAGMTNLHLVEEECRPDGNFSAVSSPNPEDDGSFKGSVAMGKKVDALGLLATDPDVDRIRLGIPHQENYLLLSGNQLGVLLLAYLLQTKRLPEEPYIITTVVSSPLIEKIATPRGIVVHKTLTGFKYIADVLNRELALGREGFLMGVEESCGYLLSPIARDKDAVSASLVITEMLCYLREKGLSAFDYLESIYRQWGYHYEYLFSLTKKGASGPQAIEKMMERFRKAPPARLGKSNIVDIQDFLQKEPPLRENLLSFTSEAGQRVWVRPSGTEPKIKFYFHLSLEKGATLSYNDATKQLGALFVEIRDAFCFDGSVL